MTRFVSATNEAESEQPSIVMTVFADMDFASGNLYVHDGVGTISFGGNDYLGVGKFGGMDGATKDSLEVIARPVNLTLSGVDAALLSTAMTEDYQNRAVVIYVGWFDRTTGALLDTPETIWEGRMDYMEISISGGSGEIKLSCEHRLRREPRIARYTDEDQQIAYSGDTFFDLLPFILGFKAKWGGERSQFAAGDPLGGGGRGGGRTPARPSGV